MILATPNAVKVTIQRSNQKLVRGPRKECKIKLQSNLQHVFATRSEPGPRVMDHDPTPDADALLQNHGSD